jgi:hypothetical protein
MPAVRARAAHHSRHLLRQPSAGTSTNIYDPIANTAAAMNCVMKRYNVRRDGANLAASVCQFNPTCGPCGY